MKRTSHWALVMLVVLVGVGAAGVAGAAGSVGVDASVDGKALRAATESRPIKLDPGKPANLTVRVRNDSDATVDVRKVRLEGKVLGLTFYAYDTTVGLVVAPHSRETRTIVLDLAGLQGQATGLIPSSVLLLDRHRHVIASEKTIVDVRGSVRSVYGAFGLALIIATGVSLASALAAMALGRLHPNRARRALRFLVPGIGTGLVLLFSLSAFRVLAPKASRSIPCILGSSLAFFVVGYLTPTPDTGEDEDEEQDFGQFERALPAPPTIVPIGPGREGDDS